jgi:hypothetical protein
MSKQLMIDTLKNNHTQRINFTYTGTTGFVFRVVPGDFTTVMLNIEQGNIGVQEGGAPVGKARYSLRNDGASRANTFYLGRNNAAPKVFESLLVHESVHAIFDLKGISMPWLDNEVLAYIAQGFYIMSAGEDGGLSEEAMLGLEIARSFQNTKKDPFWLDALKNSLLTNPTYHSFIRGTFQGDG